jgi:riboflavin kinase/FMN adenylyltransferase
MEIFRNSTKDLENARGGVFALGNFDGVHLGHKEIIAKATSIGQKKNIPSGVLIFQPHPRKFFRPGDENFIISDIKTRSYLLENCNLDFLGILDFNKEMSNLTPFEFVDKIINQAINVSHLIVGYNFKFGKDRSGDVKVLTDICKKLKIDLSIIDKVEADNYIFSSSSVRECLRKGDLKAAKKILGDYWVVKGEVIKGDQRGRQIGFPTANISMEGWIEALFGVYAVNINVDGLFYRGVANLGVRPTFGKSSPILEVHLFDYSGDLYGKDIIISFIDFIRKEKKFDGIESLKKQIEIDSAKAIEFVIEN